MDPEKTPRERAEDLIRLLVPNWRLNPRQGLWAIRIGIFLSLLIAIGYPYGITLWDWIKLLVVPAAIAAASLCLWFNQQQQKSALEIAEQRAQDEALQAYLDQMSQLLTDKDRTLRQAIEDDKVRTLARARTLTVLARLEGSCKWSVLMFLQEAGLIGVEDGSGVSLRWANLQKAELGEVVLKGADLRETKMQDANLTKAYLSGADLSRINLSTVNLKGATVTNDQLSSCDSLEGATMPNGQKYEDWLESKGRGESSGTS